MKKGFHTLSPQMRVSLNMVGLNGLFWFAWAFGCYQTVYLQSVGFSASQLGILNALASGVTIASVAFWGMVSDKIGSLRRVLITVLVGGCSMYAITPLLPADLPYSALIFTIFLPLASFFRGSQSTFAENILVRNCNEFRLNYGVLRSAGSLLFAIGSVIIAALLPTVGVRSTFWISGLLMIPVIILTIFAHEPNSSVGKKRKKLGVGELFKNKAYVMLLVFAFIFYVAVACEGNFIPYFMTDQNISSEKYGILLAYRALLEIPFLVIITKLRARFPLRVLVAVGAGLICVECFGLSLVAKSLAGMLAFATFFGLGNGLFIGSSLNYVYELAPDNLKASAQAFYASVSSIAGIVGNLLGGVLFDAIGAKPFYFVTGCTYLLSVAVFVASFTIKKKAK